MRVRGNADETHLELAVFLMEQDTQSASLHTAIDAIVFPMPPSSTLQSGIPTRSGRLMCVSNSFQRHSLRRKVCGTNATLNRNSQRTFSATSDEVSTRRP